MGTICYLSFLYPRKPGFSLDLLHWNLWVMGLGIGPSKFLPFILSRVTITVAMKSISPGRFCVLLFKNNSCDFYKRRLPLALGSHSFSMKHTKQRVFFLPFNTKGKVLSLGQLVSQVNNNWDVLCAGLSPDSYRRSQALASYISKRYVYKTN